MKYPEFVKTPRGNIRFFNNLNVTIEFEDSISEMVTVCTHHNSDGVVELEVSCNRTAELEYEDGVVRVSRVKREDAHED